MTVDYLKPAKLDDALTVETRITAMSGVRVEMAQRVRRGETVLVTAEVMAATIGGDGRPCRMPDAMRALFAPLVSDPSVGL
jgi:acyl-CoA thioester hydrolase